MGHQYRISLHVISFYTQTVWLMEMLEMVLPKEHVVLVSFVTPMGIASKVRSTNDLFTSTFSFRDKMLPIYDETISQ